jgi:cation diffusion facilitator family transporter
VRDVATGSDGYYLQSERVTLVGIWLNVLLTIFKFVAGILASSRALVADALESFFDIISTGIVMVSLRISRKPRDDDHPFGHQKVETLASGMVGLFLLVTGLLILRSAYLVLRSGTSFQPGAFALIASAVTVLVKEGLYRYTVRVGNLFGSQLIIANALHHRSDAISSLVTLFAIALAFFGLRVFDTLGSALVGLIILRMSWGILWGTANVLMDKAPSVEFQERLKSEISRVDGVKEITSVRTRPIGSFYHVEVKIGVDKNITVEQGHQIGRQTEINIMKTFPRVFDVTVHLNPR